MSHYFIKRGEKVHGPYSTKQVKSGLESGKLKDADLISESKSGPWQTVTAQLQEPAPVAEAVGEDFPEGEGSLFDSVEIPATTTTFKPSYPAVQPSGTSETFAKQETKSVESKPSEKATPMSALEEAEKELRQQQQDQKKAQAWDVSNVFAGMSILGSSTWELVKTEGIGSAIQNLKQALTDPEKKPAATGIISLLLSPVILLLLVGPLYLLGSALIPETSSYQANSGITNAQASVDAEVEKDQSRAKRTRETPSDTRPATQIPYRYQGLWRMRSVSFDEGRTVSHDNGKPFVFVKDGRIESRVSGTPNQRVVQVRERQGGCILVLDNNLVWTLLDTNEGVTKVIVYGNGGKERIRYLVMIQ
jgi:hypothetical protein